MIRGKNYGRLWRKRYYKNGKLNGLLEEYNEDGSLRMTQTWKDDKLIKMNGEALQ